jgi:hypothetical protein
MGSAREGNRLREKWAKITYVTAGTVYGCVPELVLIEVILRGPPVTIVNVVPFSTDINVVVSNSSASPPSSSFKACGIFWMDADGCGGFPIAFGEWFAPEGPGAFPVGLFEIGLAIPLGLLSLVVGIGTAIGIVESVGRAPGSIGVGIAPGSIIFVFIGMRWWIFGLCTGKASSLVGTSSSGVSIGRQFGTGPIEVTRDSVGFWEAIQG